MLLLIPLLLAAHPFDSDYLPGLMRTQPERFAVALDPAQAVENRVQILVSFVKKDGGRLTLERHGFRVDAEYFYPASALKTCAAVASLQRLAELQAAGKKVGLHSPLVFHPRLPGERLEREDETNVEGGRVTLAHLIRKMSLISSNEAFNRLYEYAGHEQLNRRMQAAGLSGTTFIHRLSRVLPPEANRKTPRIDIEGEGGVVTLPAADSPLDLELSGLKGIDVGREHIDPVTRKRVAAPFSFARKNRQSLVDLQNMLVMIVRPDVDLGLKGFALKPAHREFLAEAMRQWPSESKNPVLSERRYRPARFKPVLPGLLKVHPRSRWTVYNKAGKAYGFRVENAYVVDRETNRGVFITAAIHANPNAVVNDGEYAYDTVADPLIHALAEAVVRSPRFSGGGE